jgi:primase-polymerase (primpol)-like protein
MNDKEATFKVGDKVVFTGVQNIRKGSGTNYQITGETKVGDVYEIEDGPRFANGYTWYDLKGADWVADVGKFKIYEKPEIPPVSPPQPSPCEECIKQVEILKEENKGLNEALEKSKNETKLAKEREVYLEGVVEEYKASEKSLTERNEYLEQEVARLEKEKGELEYELSQLKNNKQFFDKIIEWLNNLLKKVFGGK